MTRTAATPRLVVLGVRHHRARFAAAIERAFAALNPTRVLIEGPPEATPLVSFAASPNMAPPVALAVTRRRRKADRGPLASSIDARFTPFAAFSPEWVALRWALEAGRPVRFIDAPVGARFGDMSGDLRAATSREQTSPDESFPDEISTNYSSPDQTSTSLNSSGRVSRNQDPWEAMIEPLAADTTIEPLAFFAAAARAVADWRAASSPDDPFTALREAAMRQEIRAELNRARVAMKSGGEQERIAVVCGVWHASAFIGLRKRRAPFAADDAALLKGVATLPVDVAWVPWSLAALARDSGGYGAGPIDPGWEAHLWATRDAVAAAPVRWLVETARALRTEDEASPASTLGAARLSEALSALRGRVAPGLAELTDASVAALAGGDAARVEACRLKLLDEGGVGRAPDDAPQAPLARDVAATARRLRIPLSAEGVAPLQLDLRNDVSKARSVFLRRLRWLGALPADALIDAADPTRVAGARGARGGFRETWRFRWTAGAAATLAEASGAGATLQAAAEAVARQALDAAEDASAIIAVAEASAAADLPQAFDAAMNQFFAEAPGRDDVDGLTAALGAIARLIRYGGVDASRIARVRALAPLLVEKLAAAAPLAALGGSTGGSDATTAAALVDLLSDADATIALLSSEADDAALTAARARWPLALARIAGDPRSAPAPQGWCAARLARDAPTHAAQSLAHAFRQAPADHAALWLDGYFVGGGAADDQAVRVVDDWLSSLSMAAFERCLPTLRRAFATLGPGHRRRLSIRVATAAAGEGASAGDAPEIVWSADAVAAARPLLDLLLPLDDDGSNDGPVDERPSDGQAS